MRWKVQGLAAAAVLTGWATSAASQEQVENPLTLDGFYDSAGTRREGAPPEWRRRPLPTERDFPEPLFRRGRGSWHVVVTCRAEPDGRLTECRAERESEAGLGLGPSAVRIARRGRLEGPVAPDATGAQPTIRTTISYHIL